MFIIYPFQVFILIIFFNADYIYVIICSNFNLMVNILHLVVENLDLELQ